MNEMQMECAHCSCYHTGKAPIMPSWPAVDARCCACRLTSDRKTTTKESN